MSNPLREISTEAGLSVVTESGALVLADGYELDLRPPGQPCGLVYHRATGILEWASAERAAAYRVYHSSGVGRPFSLLGETDLTLTDAGVLAADQHRAFRVSGVNTDAGLEGPPSPTIHAAGPKRKL